MTRFTFINLVFEDRMQVDLEACEYSARKFRADPGEIVVAGSVRRENHDLS